MAVVENDTPKFSLFGNIFMKGESIFINSKFLIYNYLNFKAVSAYIHWILRHKCLRLAIFLKDFATFIFAIQFDSSHSATFNFAISPQIRKHLCRKYLFRILLYPH